MACMQAATSSAEHITVAEASIHYSTFIKKFAKKLCKNKQNVPTMRFMQKIIRL